MDGGGGEEDSFETMTTNDLFLTPDVPTTGTCFECGRDGDLHEHHVIPRALGGTRTVPLCEFCHSLVHGRNMVKHTRLVRKGIAEARRKGVTLGRPPGSEVGAAAFLVKHRDVVKLLREGQSVRHSAAITGKGTSTVMRVAKAMKGGQP